MYILAVIAAVLLGPESENADPSEPVENEGRPVEGPTAVVAPGADDSAHSPAVVEGGEQTASTGAATAVSTGGKPRGLQRHRLVYKNLTAARYNPLGLINEFTFGWRMQLVNKNTTLFKDSYMALKAHTFLTPAFGRVGPMFELQPLAVLNLQVIYSAVGYFKTFDQLQSLQSPAADYADSDLEKSTDRSYPGLGHMVTLSALLQAKVGRVALRDNPKFYYAAFDLKSDPVSGRADTVYYDQTLDILQPNQSWTTTNDLDLLYLFDFGLRVGARYTYTHAFYRDSMYLPGESTKNRNDTHRVGPAILYAPPKWRAKAAKRTGLSRKRWYNPTAFMLVQWWAKHRWRAGQDVSAGVPYFLIGFTFEGDWHP